QSPGRQFQRNAAGAGVDRSVGPERGSCIARQRRGSLIKLPAMPGTDRQFAYRQKTYTHHDIEGMTRGVEEDGFALVPRVLSTDEVEAACEHIDQLKPIHWDRLGPTDHFKNVLNQDTYFLQFIDRAPIIDLAESVMTSECHIIGETAWRSH